jgi:hypothetical protein
MSFTLVGIVIMLLASAAFNGAPIVLRLATRTLPDHTGAALLHAVLTRRAGLAGLVLSLLGWSLQIVALMYISLTLGRILFAAGLGLLLLVRKATVDKALPEVSKFGGTILRTSLTKEAEDKLQAALNQGTAPGTAEPVGASTA